MIVYRVEYKNGCGPYNGPIDVNFFLDHSDDVHPVAKAPHEWFQVNVRYGFTSWAKACRWWGHWGQKGIKILKEGGCVVRAFDVQSVDVFELDDKQCVFNYDRARLVEQLPYDLLLNEQLTLRVGVDRLHNKLIR